MRPWHSPVTLFSLVTFIYFPSMISSQSCQKNCGKIPMKYPFGSGPGCGNPRFHQYITCNDQKLTLTTHTGCYTVTSIDYSSQLIFLSDSSMSTCSCTQPSKGFGLDWDAPFSFHESNIFALLDCSTTSSPIFKPNSYIGGNTSNTLPLCDKDGASSICSFLYSCRAISQFNLPISTCCVYTPVDLGPSFEMNLQELQCNSYSGFYSFGGEQSDPQNWKYGLVLKYKFNVLNEYPRLCASCEKSSGVCGYSGEYNTFVCNCADGFNTTNDCYFGQSYANSCRLLPLQTGTWITFTMVLLMAWIVLPD